MDLDVLRIFCAVAREGGVTQAAARLGRVPSNVSTRIQKLEEDLGVALFVRTAKSMQLSTAGHTLLGYADRLLALETEARQAVAGMQGGVLRIGSMESTAAARLPRPLAAFSARNPDTRLDLGTGTSRSLMAQLREGQLDVAFAALLPGVGAPELAEAGLSGRPLWKEELLLLLPPGEKARDLQHVRVRTLAAFKPGCAYRARAEAALGMEADLAWRVHELGSYHAMVAAVAAGHCVSVLPRSVWVLAGMPEGLRTLRVGYADTWMLWRTGYGAPVLARLAAAMGEGAQT